LGLNSIEKYARPAFDKAVDAYFETPGLAERLPPLTRLNLFRNAYEKKLALAGMKYHPSIMYGHSRGAAHVADIPEEFWYLDGELFPDRNKTETSYRRVGLDGAMSIANNQDIDNIRQGQLFDAILGLGGKKNYVVQKNETFHRTWVNDNN